MSDEPTRVERALAAYLEAAELGDPPPPRVDLTAKENEELDDLISLVSATAHIPLGQRESESEPSLESLSHDRVETVGKHIIEQVQRELLHSVRVRPDDAIGVEHLGGTEVLERWILGTLGGRIRMLVLNTHVISEIESMPTLLSETARVFRSFPDTSAISLVDLNADTLILEPQDCGPRIILPQGNLLARKYSRPIQDAVTAIAAFLNELVPYWDPVAPAVGGRAPIDVEGIAAHYALEAVTEQNAIGSKARKSNPKHEALQALGTIEKTRLRDLATAVYEGREDPKTVRDVLARLASKQ